MKRLVRVAIRASCGNGGHKHLSPEAVFAHTRFFRSGMDVRVLSLSWIGSREPTRLFGKPLKEEKYLFSPRQSTRGVVEGARFTPYLSDGRSIERYTALHTRLVVIG